MSYHNNENFAFNEMMTHIPLCTHIKPQNILVIGDANEGLKKEIAKHKETKATYGDSSIIISKNEREVDVIIITSQFKDKSLISDIQKVLKDDGILVFLSESFSQDEQKLKDDLSLMGEHFWIAMPYKFGHSTAIIASRKYHPTADIVLQRSDLLDGLDYYSSEIHLASFIFPASIHRKLTGIAKR